MQTRSILIAGEAGQGIDKISDILAGALTKYGYYVFVYRDYQSRIKGGLNFNVISFSKNKIYSSENHYDICVFLSENISDDMVNAVKNGGIIICDKKVEELRSDILNKIKAKKGICQSIDCDDIIRKHGFNKIVANSILIGALAKVLGMEKQIFFDIFNVEFKKFLKENKQAFEIGYSIELSERGKSKRGLKLSKTKAEIIYLKGNDAIAYAFRLAGIEAYLAYPMTPSTGLLHALAKTNGFVYQPENEIAVINAALGISACGKKVAIGSSGGGFALMIEALSFAGMAELPLVIYLVSRYGPSTGAPTYTSQADLKFAINSGHGEFAKVVLSLTDIKSAMLNAIKAFELAYSYRIPVILLADKNFAESGFSIDKEELREVESYAKQYLEREKQRQQRQQRLMKAAKNEKSESEEGLSKVYDLKDPFCMLPELGVERFKLSSYEHDEYGFFNESQRVMLAMSGRRKERIEKIKAIMQKLATYKIYNKKAKKIIIAYGSTVNVLLDFISRNKDYGLIAIECLKPFPSIVKALGLGRSKKGKKESKKLFVVECSITSQLSDLIAETDGIVIPESNKILKHDGRPFTVDELVELFSESKKKISNKNK